MLLILKTLLSKNVKILASPERSFVIITTTNIMANLRFGPMANTMPNIWEKKRSLAVPNGPQCIEQQNVRFLVVEHSL